MDSSFLQGLTPEQLEQLMQLGTLDEAGTDLDAQMQQALALQQPQLRDHASGWGAAGEGIANIINSARGGMMQDDVSGQKAGLRKKKDDARTKYAQLLGTTNLGPGTPVRKNASLDDEAALEAFLQAPTPFGYGG